MAGGGGKQTNKKTNQKGSGSRVSGVCRRAAGGRHANRPVPSHRRNSDGRLHPRLGGPPEALWHEGEGEKSSRPGATRVTRAVSQQ